METSGKYTKVEAGLRESLMPESEVPANETTTRTKATHICQCLIPGRKIKITAIIVSILAITTFVVKSGLLLTRYGAAVNTEICKPLPESSESGSANLETTTTSSNMDEAEEKHLADTYAFTVAICAVVNVLRIMEYSLLCYGLTKFVWKCCREKETTERLKAIISNSWKSVVAACIVLTPYFILGIVAIPILGVVQEVVYSKSCNKAAHISIVFFAYCGVN